MWWQLKSNKKKFDAMKTFEIFESDYTYRLHILKIMNWKHLKLLKVIIPIDFRF
jgi:hypothetical protein